MGRSLANILFSAFGSVVDGNRARSGEPRRTQRSAPGTADDVGVLLAYARKVVIVPGYGLAVAQAQHTVRELADTAGEARRRGATTPSIRWPAACPGT